MTAIPVPINSTLQWCAMARTACSTHVPCRTYGALLCPLIGSYYADTIYDWVKHNPLSISSNYISDKHYI